VTDLGSVLKVEFTGFVEARLGNRLVKVLQRNQSIYIYNEELAHRVMEVKKFYNLSRS
jgi:hypothetical protein